MVPIDRLGYQAGHTFRDYVWVVAARYVHGCAPALAPRCALGCLPSHCTFTMSHGLVLCHYHVCRCHSAEKLYQQRPPNHARDQITQHNPVEQCRTSARVEGAT